MCFFRRKRKQKQALEAQKATVVSQENVESQVATKPVVEDLQEVHAEKETVVEEDIKVVKDEVEVSTIKHEEIIEDVEEPTKSEQTKTPKIAKYHVSQNKDEDSEHFKKWRVRKEGSTKTIKFFDTQKEAIAFAEQLADSQGSSVVIHKVDGSIRKQDYAKKK